MAKDTKEVKRRLAMALERLYPNQESFSTAEIMDALEIMGEFR